MKKLLIILLLALSINIFIPSKSEAMGLFYTNATYPVLATGLEVKDVNKLKKACVETKTILFLVEKGNASIDEAIKKAGITKISHIDVHEKSIFIFWRKQTVMVYGE